jgi:hypothetical protein
MEPFNAAEAAAIDFNDEAETRLWNDAAAVAERYQVTDLHF